jgi:hypothetical protein
VLETITTEKLIESARPGPVRAGGLGAGLDVVRRLATRLSLSNDELTGGAIAVARIVRRVT